jgi:hypothetical protein
MQNSIQLLSAKRKMVLKNEIWMADNDCVHGSRVACLQPAIAGGVHPAFRN